MLKPLLWLHDLSLVRGSIERVGQSQPIDHSQSSSHVSQPPEEPVQVEAPTPHEALINTIGEIRNMLQIDTVSKKFSKEDAWLHELARKTGQDGELPNDDELKQMAQIVEAVRGKLRGEVDKVDKAMIGTKNFDDLLQVKLQLQQDLANAPNPQQRDHIKALLAKVDDRLTEKFNKLETHVIGDDDVVRYRKKLEKANPAELAAIKDALLNASARHPEARSKLIANPNTPAEFLQNMVRDGNCPLPTLLQLAAGDTDGSKGVRDMALAAIKSRFPAQDPVPPHVDMGEWQIDPSKRIGGSNLTGWIKGPGDEWAIVKSTVNCDRHDDGTIVPRMDLKYGGLQEMRQMGMNVDGVEIVDTSPVAIERATYVLGTWLDLPINKVQVGKLDLTTEQPGIRLPQDGDFDFQQRYLNQTRQYYENFDVSISHSVGAGAQRIDESPLKDELGLQETDFDCVKRPPYNGISNWNRDDGGALFTELRQRVDNPEIFDRMFFFDLVIDNVDRHGGNALLTPSEDGKFKVHLIDHDQSFGNIDCDETKQGLKKHATREDRKERFQDYLVSLNEDKNQLHVRNILPDLYRFAALTDDQLDHQLFAGVEEQMGHKDEEIQLLKDKRDMVRDWLKTHGE